MHDESCSWACAVLTFCFFMGGVLLGIHIAGDSSTKEFKKQAIKNNFGHWVVDEEGNTKFEWNAVEKEQK